MILFSVSRIQTYEKCPYLFYIKYILGRKEMPTPFLAIGKAVHAVIETAGKARNADPGFIRSLCQAVSSAAEINEDIYPMISRDIVVDSIREEGARYEEHFQMPLDEEAPFSPEIQGYIDREIFKNGEVVVTDWKSGYKEYNALDTHQLGIYALYLTKKYKAPVRGKLVFLRTGNVSEHLFSPEDIEAAREWAIKAVYEIQSRIISLQNGADASDVFPQTKGTACEGCSWAQECIRPEKLPDTINSYDDAVAISKEIICLEETVNQKKEMLKNFIETTKKPVVVGSKEFALVTSQYWKWPVEAVRKAFEELQSKGLDPFEVLTITASTLKKVSWDNDTIRNLGATAAKSIQLRLRKAG